MRPQPGTDYYASDADMAEYYGTGEDWAAKLEVCQSCGGTGLDEMLRDGRTPCPECHFAGRQQGAENG